MKTRFIPPAEGLFAFQLIPSRRRGILPEQLVRAREHSSDDVLLAIFASTIVTHVLLPFHRPHHPPLLTTRTVRTQFRKTENALAPPAALERSGEHD